MSESEIRRELEKLLDAADVERIMEMVAEYGSDRACDGASDAIRDYDERG